MLKSNVGGIDRILRIVAGIVLIALTLMGVIGMWGWIGIVALATGLFRTCPIYSLLGFSTCPVSTAK
jgi:membrane protein implicated in regulation of membrane protease activity